MTVKILLVIMAVCIVGGFAAGWFLHKPPEFEAYNPPLPDSTRIVLLETRLDSTTHVADSLLAEIRKRDRKPVYWHGAARDTDTIEPLAPLGVTLMDSAYCAEMVARRDSMVGFLAMPWMDRHRWTATKGESTFVSGTLKVTVDPVRKQTHPDIAVDSLRVLAPAPEKRGVPLAWTVIMAIASFFAGRLL